MKLILLLFGSAWMYFSYINAQLFLFDDEIAELRIFSSKLNGSLNFRNILFIDRHLPVKILVHGYRQHTTDYLYSMIVKNYVEHRHVTMITVDYPRLAFSTYQECYFGIHSVEMYVAQFIRFLNFLGIPAKNVHLIGHSLGAQMVGRMGNAYSNITKGRKLGRISSLDPARMGFSSVLNLPYYKIHSDSAEVVDIVHTDTRTIGVIEPVGTVDFYVNHGFAPQPGCDDDVDLIPLIENIPPWDGWIIPLHGAGKDPRHVLDVCSHARSLQLFAQSIVMSDSLVGQKCLIWDIISRTCLTSGPEVVIYGEDMPLDTIGVYFLNTTSTAPFFNVPLEG